MRQSVGRVRGPAADRRVVDNPLKPHGAMLLILAGGAAVAGVGGLAHGTDNVVPVAAAAAAAVYWGVRGLRLYLQPFAWPPGAPAGICGERTDVSALLEELPNDDSHLGTYTPLTGLWELIARAVVPHFTYPTPATRTLFRLVGQGVGAAVAYALVGVLLLANGVTAAGVVLALGAAAVAGVRVRSSCTPPRPKTRPVRRRWSG